MAAESPRSTPPPTAVKFAPPKGFHAELRARAAEHFARAGHPPRGGFRMYLDALVVAGWAAGSYLALVFLAGTWWQVALAALSLACAVAAIGFKIQHDGGHGAFSERQWVNRLTAMALDAIGGSSYVWRFKHNVLHHSYTNLAGVDDDIELGALGRLSPAHRHRWFHRFQHLYIWPLYTTVALKWQLVDDFVRVARGRIGPQRFPRPRGWDLVGLIGGKTFALSLALLVPALFHPLWIVLVVYLATMMMIGFLLAVVFQLAHSVREAEHPDLPPDVSRIESEWAVHQVRTTVDFARANPVLTWFLGGLNFQVVHHLFPRVSHVHYPALARIVEEVSARHGVRYMAHRSFLGAIASHFLFLREMGRGPSIAS